MAKRGDLAIVRTASRISVQNGDAYTTVSYTPAVVTSITGDGSVKAVREITGADAAAGETKPRTVAHLGTHSMIVLSQTDGSVVECLQAMIARRAGEGGDLSACEPAVAT